MMNVEAIRRLVLDGYVMPEDDIDAQIQAWRDDEGSMDNGDGFVDQLVARQAITSFQGTALRAGIPGPYKLGPYQVFDRIAGGRFGSVFRAVHEKFDQWVCLKVFPKPLNDDFEGSIRLARELRVAVQLDHPNLVRTYQVGRIGETVFMAIEDLQGETLADRLRHEADNLTLELPLQESLRLAHQIARGLTHLHSLGIVHRNIEPAAIWITSTGHAKLMEFGATRDALTELDKESPDDTSITMVSQQVLGNYDYLPPEQALDEHAADARSDVYSLGCLLFHCLTGEVVFPDVNAIRKVMRHASESPRSVSDLNPDVPEAVAQVVAMMLSKEPDDRYQRAEDVAEALKPLIELDDDLVTAAIDADPRFLQWSRSTDDLSVEQDATAERCSGQADLAEWMGTEQQKDES